MTRARIRWRNLARLAGGALAVVLALAILPRALEPPGPEPLPADVGLAGVPSGATGAAGPLARTAPADPARHRAVDRDGESQEQRRRAVRADGRNRRADSVRRRSGKSRRAPGLAGARTGAGKHSDGDLAGNASIGPVASISPGPSRPSAPSSPSAPPVAAARPAPPPVPPVPAPAAKPFPAPDRPSPGRRPGSTSQFGFEY